MGSVPSTHAQAPPHFGKPSVELDTLAPRALIGNDDRWKVVNPTVYYASTAGYIKDHCSSTLIGPSTALSAAHCFYQNGWISHQGFYFGAYNPYNESPSAPFEARSFNGQVYFPASVTIPSAWISNQYDWSYDYAVIEFSPNSSPGTYAGWLGTQNAASGVPYLYLLGYPHDKLFQPVMWGAAGAPGDRICGIFSCSSTRKYYADMYPGTSGACVYGADLKCYGINVAEAPDANPPYNIMRDWDTALYNFFHSHGNWP